MSAPIAPIAALGNIAGALPTAATTQPDAVNANSATDFASVLGQGFDAVQSQQSVADQLAVQAATGQLIDPSTYTIAATQASLMTQLATTIETKGVEAFNTIMSMQA